jgi:glutamate-1-semialdehyde aminotransferase
VSPDFNRYRYIAPYHPATVIRNAEDLEKLTDVEKVEQEFRIRMMNHEIFVVHGGGALSTAHNEKDIDQLIAATGEVAAEMVRQET